MTALLAIETSANLCSVAVAQHGEIIDIVVSEPRGHTRHLLPAIDRLLIDAGLTLRRLDAIAVTTGPGSFTGLRIGIGVAQGLAYGADLPALPLSSLATLAQGAVRSGQLAHDDVAVTVLDARMDEVYWGLYQVAGELVVALRPDRVSTPHALTLDPDLSAGTRYVGLGDGVRAGVSADLDRERLALRGGERLRIGEPGDRPARVEDHGGRDDRPGERPAGPRGALAGPRW